MSRLFADKMNVKKVPPRWQRLGFASEEDMNEHGAIYNKQEKKRRTENVRN